MVKKKYIKVLIVALLLVAVILCNYIPKEVDTNFETKVYASGKVEVVNPTIDTTFKRGKEVAILSEKWMQFYEAYKVSKDYSVVNNYYEKGVENTKPIVVNLTWSNSDSDCMYYVLCLSKNMDMSDAEEFFTQDPTYSFNNLYAGTTYYFQVRAYYKDYTIISRKFDFKTVDFIRTIDIEGVQNARDIGNKYTADGTKRIKQGIVYRSANLNLVTENGKDQAINGYGIKSDLDLREKQSTAVSPLGSKVNYFNYSSTDSGSLGSPFYISGNPNTGTGLDSIAYQPACRDNLKVFTNPDNYPIIFHCAIGRDRTGTLAILLDLVCGIKTEDIMLDYFVYVFSSVTNEQDISVMSPGVNNIFNYFENYVGKDNISSGTIYQRAEEYCLDIGLTQSEVNAIRANMLEEV